MGDLAPGLVLRWLREDGGRVDGRHQQRGGTLLIRGARREDAGVYICQGRDTRGAVIFQYRAELVIAGGPFS